MFLWQNQVLAESDVILIIGKSDGQISMCNQSMWEIYNHIEERNVVTIVSADILLLSSVWSWTRTLLTTFHKHFLDLNFSIIDFEHSLDPQATFQYRGKPAWYDDCYLNKFVSVMLLEDRYFGENSLTYCYILFIGHSWNRANGPCPYLGSECSSSGHGGLSQETSWRVANTEWTTCGAADALISGIGRFKRIREFGTTPLTSPAFLEPWRNVIDFQIAKIY